MGSTALGRRRRAGQYKLHAAFKAQPPAGEEINCSAAGARNRLNRFPVACAVGVAPPPRMPRRRVRKCGPGSVIRPERGLAIQPHPPPHCGGGRGVPLASCYRLTPTPDEQHLQWTLHSRHRYTSSHNTLGFLPIQESHRRTWKRTRLLGACAGHHAMHLHRNCTSDPYTGCRPASVHTGFTLLAEGLCASRGTLSAAHTTHTHSAPPPHVKTANTVF